MPRVPELIKTRGPQLFLSSISALIGAGAVLMFSASFGTPQDTLMNRIIVLEADVKATQETAKALRIDMNARLLALESKMDILLQKIQANEQLP